MELRREGEREHSDFSVSKLLAGVIVSIAQVYVFLAIARFWGVKPPWTGYLLGLPTIFLAGLLFFLGRPGWAVASLVVGLLVLLFFHLEGNFAKTTWLGCNRT